VRLKTLALLFIFVYESMNRELQIRPIYECRYDERLKPKSEESTHLESTVEREWEKKIGTEESVRVLSVFSYSS